MHLTWNGDDWDILIGHHPRRAALLHIEISCLEKSPTGIQRDKNSDCSTVNPHPISTSDAVKCIWELFSDVDRQHQHVKC